MVDFFYGVEIMPREARKISETGIYRIIIRGINRQRIFEDDEDYDRYEHLFQKRFKSEVVESDAYLITVLRYIHQNPVQAGIVNSIENE